MTHPHAPDAAFAAALLDSRARWRDLALLAADLLFETDAEGRFTFLAPDTVLGRPAAALIGDTARAWLVDPAAPDPFAGGAVRGLRAWLRLGGGEARCLEFTALPCAGGLRGAARDVTVEERQDDLTARALYRTTALGRLLGTALRGRGERQAEAALGTLLAGVPHALGCAGAALLRRSAEGWQLDATAGEDPAAILGALPPPGTPPPPGPAALVAVGRDLALLAWRDPPFDADEHALLGALAEPIAALHAEAARQRDLDQAAHTDALTGLLNRRGFVDALRARLAQPNAPAGTIAYIDLDRLKPLNDLHGHAAGDAALRAMAQRLRGAARPGDLAARLGGDEFALWLDGIEPDLAAARCAGLGDPGPLPGWPQAGADAVRASLGLAAARPDDTAETLVGRADHAMYEVKHGRCAA
ncbi:diguanylate cyclase domain-containing protein [Falsiroseomonas sp. CW058]|uniref:GGDEF domain-containing protein n=1 Tax=Falsiroseomonas sp. CW058 TaxID=3388664 RepID=UPI003D313278